MDQQIFDVEEGIEARNLFAWATCRAPPLCGINCGVV